MRRSFLLLGLALAHPASPARSEETAAEAQAPFRVLRVARGDEVTYQVVSEKNATSEKDRLAQEAREEIKAWEGKRNAFQKDKANKGVTFPDPKPDEVVVNTVKDKIPTEAEAKQYAEERQRKEDGCYAVVRVTGLDGATELEIIPQRKVKGKEAALNAEYQKEHDAWKAKVKAFYADPAHHTEAPEGDHHDHDGEAPTHGPACPYEEPKKPRLVPVQKDLPDREKAEQALAELDRAEKARK